MTSGSRAVSPPARNPRSIRLDPIAVLTLAALAMVVFWPALALILRAASDASGPALGNAFNPSPWSAVSRPLGLARTSLEVVACAQLLALPLGIALAVLLFRTDLMGRQLWIALLAVLVFVPMPLHAAAWLGAFGNLGRSQLLGGAPLLRGVVGAGLVHGLAALPWVVLLVGLGLCRVDRPLEEAALLESTPLGVVARVSLPGSLGAILAAALLVAVQAGGDMTVTDLVQVRTYAEEAYLQAQLGGGPTAAARTALGPLLLLSAGLALTFPYLRSHDPLRPSAQTPHARQWRLGPSRIAASLAATALVAPLAVLPLGALVWRAGRVAGFAAAGRPPSWSLHGLLGTLTRAWPDLTQGALWTPGLNPNDLGAILPYLATTPLAGTALASAIAATIAASIAWSLAWKARNHPDWMLIALLVITLTLATPGPVLGMALKLAYLPVTWVHDTPVILVLTLAARTLPYALLILIPAHRAIPTRLLDAATIEGMGQLERVRWVAWPWTAAALAAAWAVAMALGVGELAATNLVLPPGYTTLSFRVWSLLHTGVESHLAGVALWLVAFHGLLGAGAAVCLGRSLR